jgi:hypothetical protein
VRGKFDRNNRSIDIQVEGNIRKKFVLVGDWIGDFYVSPEALLKLYNLERRLCMFIDAKDALSGFRVGQNLIYLYPREEGDYREYLQEKLAEVEY